MGLHDDRLVCTTCDVALSLRVADPERTTAAMRRFFAEHAECTVRLELADERPGTASALPWGGAGSNADCPGCLGSGECWVCLGTGAVDTHYDLSVCWACAGSRCCTCCGAGSTRHLTPRRG